VPARGDCHVAADQKGDPAEHLLLRERRLVGDYPPDAGSKIVVVRHIQYHHTF
jgi:hypothetical protein